MKIKGGVEALDICGKGGTQLKAYDDLVVLKIAVKEGTKVKVTNGSISMACSDMRIIGFKELVWKNGDWETPKNEVAK